MNFTAGNAIENWVESIYTHRVQSMSTVNGAVGRAGLTPQNIDNRREYFSVTTGGTIFVAVGEAGYINRWDSSTAGSSFVGSNFWTEYYGGVTATWYGVAYSPTLSRFVAVGSDGYKTSAGAAANSWAAQYSNIGPTLRGVCWSSTWSRFVAVGDRGTILTSTDGISWTKQTIGTLKNFNAVCASGNLLVAVGDDWTVFSSVDGGVNWTNRTPYSGTTKLLSVAASATNIVVAVDSWSTILTTTPSFGGWTYTTNMTNAAFYIKSVRYVQSPIFTTFLITGDGNGSTKACFVTSEAFITISWAPLAGYTATNSKYANDIACNTSDTQYIVTVGSPVQLYSVIDGTGASITETNNYDVIFNSGAKSSTIFCSWRHDYFSVRGQYTGTITVPQQNPYYNSGGKKSSGGYTFRSGLEQYVLATHNEGYIPVYLVFDTTNNIALGTSAIDYLSSTSLRQYSIYATTTQVVLNINYSIYDTTLPQKAFNYRVLIMDQGVDSTSYLNTQPEGLKITPDRVILGRGKIDTNRNYIVKGTSGNLLTTTPHINISMGDSIGAPDSGGLFVYKNFAFQFGVGDTSIQGAVWIRDIDASSFTGRTTFIKRSFD